jgi:hypothetical protein
LLELVARDVEVVFLTEIPMVKNKLIAYVACGLMLLGTLVRAADPAPSPDSSNAAGDAALAEQFAQIGQGFLATRTINDAVWNEALALFKIAAQLDPSEPRYQRLIAEAALQSHDPQTALAALQAYARLVRDDQGVQIQIIDLYVAGMQSADGRLEYLRGIVDKSELDPAVRSYAATRATRLLYDRSQDADAEAMLATALRLNPVNLEALRMNYDRVSETGTSYERAGALLAMLRSNPAQPDVMARLAGELAAAALPMESIAWYQSAFNAAMRTGKLLEPIVLVDAAAEMLIADQYRLADTTVGTLLQGDPNGADGWYLRILLSRRTGDKEGTAKALELATTALLEKLYGVHRAFAGADPPSTQPAGELSARLGDVMDDVKKLKESGKQDLIAQDAAALTDLAWLQIYFAEQPATAKPLIDALRALLPPDNVSVPRLEGWAALMANKPDDAKVKLSAVAERDPLAMMGLIRLNAQGADADAKDQYQLQARTLVNKNAAGLLGAMLQDGLREYGGRLIPAKDADVLRERIAAFPKDWLTIIDKPQSFYSLRAEADKVAHAFGEPMMGKVSIQNISEYDLTIGDDGVIHPDLWFDVNIKGVANAQRAGIIFERITKARVLHKGQTVTQPVRLDAGELGQSLLNTPMYGMQLYFSVYTNPTSAARGAVVPGAAGYRVQLKRVVDRAATSIATQQQQQKIFDTLATGSPRDKIRLISLLQHYIMILADEKMGKGAMAKAREFQEEIRTVAGDSSPAVNAWARSVGLLLNPAERRMTLLKQQAADSYMPARALAVLIARERGVVKPEEAMQFIAQVQQNDPEPLVRELAAAVADDLAHPTTQPTTAPTLGDALTQPPAPDATSQPSAPPSQP